MTDARATTSQRHLDLGGGACSIAEAGQGGRPLLLIHGFSGAKEDFTPWLGQLADAGWHAVCYDNFGHGQSAKPAAVESYSLNSYRDQLFDVMDALGWSSTVALGHSMGGMILQEALAADRGRFSAVVFMDTNHGPLEIPPAYRLVVEADLARGGVRALLDRSIELDLFEGAPASRAVFKRDPGYRAFQETKMLETAAPVFLAMLDQIGQRPDRLDLLAGLEMPALVLVGEQDEAFIAACKEMAAAIPGAELAVLAGAAHCPQFEGTEAWWAALSGWLGRLS